ncbi:MAG: universal stress protein [Candidatus Heimdallarchaeota archaeon]|nr:universal stress protein [Candidatus Heimdallarchaeota archaeon]MBY8994733.1 universal stress protein [Candidatus Heimdallarchaeota archaeon]
MTNGEISLDSGLFSTPGDKILLPLMGFPSERDAMFIALVTAEYFGANLHIFHIASKSKRTEEFFQKEIEWLKKKSQEQNVKLEVDIKDFNPGIRPDSVILKEIQSLAPRLVIMMSRRKGLFQRFAGSIAERVARRSSSSVMIIRSPDENWVTDGTHVEPRKIIVPIGSNNPCEVSAVQIAIAIANAGETRDADITLLHVITVPETVPIIPDDDRLIIQEEKDFVKQAGMYSTMLLYPMKTKVIIGRDVGRSVSHYLNKENADLSIMGVPYVPRRLFGLFGTDTNLIYQKSKCPVVVIFHKEEC